MQHSASETDRILSLDVVRGFALLGILLLNILGFGALFAMSINPTLGFSLPSDIWVWGAVELTAEGAMRALFSMLFGAGILLFLGRGEGRGKLHFKRTFWLLIFGLFNGYILMWPGDILSTYALAGFFLYFLRNMSAKGLTILSVLLFICLFAYGVAINFGLNYFQISAGQSAEVAAEWDELQKMIYPSDAELSQELAQRTGSLKEVFLWSATEYTDMLLWAVPIF